MAEALSTDLQAELSTDSCEKDVEKEIKKVKKKLKEINNLERLNRNLNIEERDKVSWKLTKKHDLKTLLHRLLVESGVKHIDEVNLSNNSSATVNDSSCLSNHSSLNSDDTDTRTNRLLEQSSSALLSTSPIGQDQPVRPAATSTPCRRKETESSPPPPSKWCGRSVVVTSLSGHNDVVCAIDSNGRILITGSRDTTIKVWNLHDFSELRSLGFHSAAVTSVKILPMNDQPLLDVLPEEQQNNCCYGISGSLDCFIVLWNLETGKKVRQVYTYSSIQCFVYKNGRVYTGSDGGKIDVWKILDGTNVCTLSDSGCGITCMVLDGAWLCCGRTKGLVQVWNIESRELHYEWKSSITFDEDDDNEEQREGVTTSASSRCVRCICHCDNVLYWGDDGTNVKQLKWKEKQGSVDSVVKKLANHSDTMGSTGGLAVSTKHGVLFSSGYDLITGHSMINIRSISSSDDDHEYLCTIKEDLTSYISCMCVVEEGRSSNIHQGAMKEEGSDCVRIVTGGSELNVVDIHLLKNNNKKPKIKKSQSLIYSQYIDKMADSYSTDSDSIESDNEGPSDDDSRTMLHVKPLPIARGNAGVLTPQQQSWVWWLCEKCTIL